MDGYYLTTSRTENMTPSDISDALFRGDLALCPYKKLGSMDVDMILDGFLHRGIHPSSKEPRAMTILALGFNAAGIPLAQIEINDQVKSHTATPAVCTYCDKFYCGCDQSQRFGMYDILQDDSLWNADILNDDEDEDDE